MSALTETVCIVKDPGVTEARAEALAWDRLRIRGLAPASRAYRRELVALPNASVQIWQLSFQVHTQ